MPSKILDWIIILNTENSQNALKYQKSLVFSKFQLWCYFVLGSGQKLADMWLGRQHSPKVIPQIFLSQTDYMEMSIERPSQATNSSYKLQDTSQHICEILKLPSYKLQIFRTDRFSGLTFPTRTNGQKLTILSQKVFCLTDFWRISGRFLTDFLSKSDPFAIMTIKKQWIFIRGNYVVFWPWPKLFSFSHHIFVTNRAMTFILSASKHIYSSYPKHIQMVVGYLYFLPSNMLNFKNVLIENFL